MAATLQRCGRRPVWQRLVLPMSSSSWGEGPQAWVRGQRCGPAEARFFVTSRCSMKSKRWKEFSEMFLNHEDKNKRPSDLEIRQKDLPKNQPTLAERVARDRYHLFHQSDPHHGYIQPGRDPDLLKDLLNQLKHDIKHNPKELVKQNFKTLKREVGKWQEEVKEGMQVHRNMTEAMVRQGQTRQEWGFQSELELDQWVLTVDSDWGEGYSSAEFSLNSAGTAAVFRGDLSTRVPADGRTKYAGYANISSVTKRLSFARLKILDHWEDYTHLTMNVRGDGRKYMLNLRVRRDYDIQWDDRFHYPLFTRGGPYWQYVKIPFSKFYFGSKGVLQDKQSPFPAGFTTGMSITLKDRITGPFQLEIKDISLVRDKTGDDEKFAYEMYKIPDFWAGY